MWTAPGGSPPRPAPASPATPNGPEGHGASSNNQLLSDVTGDGRADAVVFFNDSTPGGSWWVAPSTGTGFAGYTKWTEGHGASSNNQLLSDVTGDGRADAVVFFNDSTPGGSWWVAPSTGTGFAGYTKWTEGHGASSNNQLLSDVTGDGRADAVVFFNDSTPGGSWWVAPSTGTGFAGYTKWTEGHGASSNNQLLSDVTGDGRADAVVFFNDSTPGGSWWVAPSTGTGFAGYTKWTEGHGVGSDGQFVGDTTGDCRGDATVFISGDGSWYVAPSLGNAFAGYTQWTLGHGASAMPRRKGISADPCFARPALAVADATASEGDSGTTDLSFSVSLDRAVGRAVTVGYSTTNVTATPADLIAASGAVTFAAGETSKTITIAVHGDTLYEANEKFHVDLSSPVNATIGDSRGVGTIVNDDPMPSLSVNDVAQLEGASGTKKFTFTLSLSAASGVQTKVTYGTADGSATAGSDYTAKPATTIGIAAGKTTQAVSVVVNGDTVVEPNETFFLNLLGAVNATITDGVGEATIRNDDPVPAISVNDVSIIEGNAGTSTLTFTLTLSTASPVQTKVNYLTTGSTATAGTDYVAASGTLSFPVGVTSRTVSVTINGDTTTEPTEKFLLKLSTPVNATIADNQGVGTIRNDD